MPSRHTPTVWQPTQQQPLEHACLDGGKHLPAGVQPMSSLHSKCNVERHCSINFIELIQVEGDTPI